jgi:hypothetical protein
MSIHNPWEGVFRFYGTVIQNPYDQGGRINSLLIVDIHYKKDGVLFDRDHCWIKHKNTKKIKSYTSMFNSLQIGDTVEFSAKVSEYIDSKGITKIGLNKVRSIYKI